MNPENFKQAWQAQSPPNRLKIDSELLLQEVRRNQQHFTATIFWRDVREVGVAILMVPLWVYLGWKLALPWAWYLTMPVLMWVALFMLVDRMRHQRQPPAAGEPLRRHVENSLAQVEHQIWLLRNIFWWYLLPLAFSSLAFFGQIAWLRRADGWSAALVVTFAALVVGVALGAAYRLNQNAVRCQLVLRRQELESLLISLNDETSAASQKPQE